MQLPFALSAFNRQVAKSPVIPMKNRFVEGVPPLTAGPVSAIARPALKYLTNFGTGPIRKIFSAPGIFNDAAFVVSGLDLYSIAAADGAATLIGTIGTSVLGDVSMAAVSVIDDTVPSRIFIADGGVLWVYSASSEATGHLQATGAIANNDTVVINGVYYKWTNGSVDTGTPDGTSSAPWLVALGANNAAALQNLYHAINADEGTPGTDYSTATTFNPYVRAYNVAAADLFVSARTPGTAGNAYTTTETGANIAWSAGTLANGGSPQLRVVTMPGDVGAISLCSINSFIIVVPVQSEALATTGRFYWIKPGNTYVDPLDFANAERSSDNAHQVAVYQDQFLVAGRETVESWVMTGNVDAPVERYSGVLYDRGSWEGTVVKVRDSVVFVDELGAVIQNKGGMKRISRPDQEERIRLAMQAAGLSPLI